MVFETLAYRQNLGRVVLGLFFLRILEHTIRETTFESYEKLTQKKRVRVNKEATVSHRRTNKLMKNKGRI